MVSTSILITLGLLLVVVLYAMVKNEFVDGNSQISGGYTVEQIILGVLAESIRGILTTWLYTHHKTNKPSIYHAIKFGVICSALIGSLWLILGSQLIGAEERLTFIIDDGIILLFQGIVSGLVLGWAYNPVKPALDSP